MESQSPEVPTLAVLSKVFERLIAESNSRLTLIDSKPPVRTVRVLVHVGAEKVAIAKVEDPMFKEGRKEPHAWIGFRQCPEAEPWYRFFLEQGAEVLAPWSTKSSAQARA